jgi:hypothetical protein
MKDVKRDGHHREHREHRDRYRAAVTLPSCSLRWKWGTEFDPVDGEAHLVVAFQVAP